MVGIFPEYLYVEEMARDTVRSTDDYNRVRINRKSR